MYEKQRLDFVPESFFWGGVPANPALALAKAAEEAESKPKAALEAKIVAEKAATEAQARAKADAEAQTAAEKAAAEAPAKLKDAEKKKELAANRAKEKCRGRKAPRCDPHGLLGAHQFENHSCGDCIRQMIGRAI